MSLLTSNAVGFASVGSTLATLFRKPSWYLKHGPIFTAFDSLDAALDAAKEKNVTIADTMIDGARSTERRMRFFAQRKGTNGLPGSMAQA